MCLKYFYFKFFLSRTTLDTTLDNTLDTTLDTTPSDFCVVGSKYIYDKIVSKTNWAIDQKRIAQKNVKYCDEKIQPNPKNSSKSKNCSVRLKLTTNRNSLFYLFSSRDFGDRCWRQKSVTHISFFVRHRNGYSPSNKCRNIK